MQQKQSLRCPRCAGEFPDREQLEAHTRKNHPDLQAPETPAVNPVCPRCGSPFTDLELLKEHEERAHPR